MVRRKFKLGQRLLALFLALAVLSTGIASVGMLNTVAADEKQDLRQPLNLPDGPTSAEQFMLELINETRLNPTEAAS